MIKNISCLFLISIMAFASSIALSGNCTIVTKTYVESLKNGNECNGILPLFSNKDDLVYSPKYGEITAKHLFCHKDKDVKYDVVNQQLLTDCVLNLTLNIEGINSSYVDVFVLDENGKIKSLSIFPDPSTL
ncbi:hypothetical protein [Endozoicomonas sp. ALD040]|uniref:hypothetical protein n=1 Tax=unclassified Endozoicomonas TaxID=2644528 RepID=UPI003BAFFDC1